jgi:hypothetical protein
MRCVECGGHKCEDERGWVTVLSPSGTIRVHYCPACMAELVSRTVVSDEADENTEEE